MSQKYIADAISVLYMYCDIDPRYEPFATRLTRIDIPLDMYSTRQFEKKGIPHLLGT